jgi:hypothetical protein
MFALRPERREVLALLGRDEQNAGHGARAGHALAALDPEISSVTLAGSRCSLVGVPSQSVTFGGAGPPAVAVMSPLGSGVGLARLAQWGLHHPIYSLNIT